MVCKPYYKICLHCAREKRMRARGLCCSCFSKVEIREQYPPTEHYRRKGWKIVREEDVDFNGGYQLAESPTQSSPGSEGKIEVLCLRFSLRVSLWHPLDRPAGVNGHPRQLPVREELVVDSGQDYDGP